MQTCRMFADVCSVCTISITFLSVNLKLHTARLPAPGRVDVFRKTKMETRLWNMTISWKSAVSRSETCQRSLLRRCVTFNVFVCVVSGFRSEGHRSCHVTYRDQFCCCNRAFSYFKLIYRLKNLKVIYIGSRSQLMDTRSLLVMTWSVRILLECFLVDILFKNWVPIIRVLSFD